MIKVENHEKIEKMAKKCETYGEFLENLTKEGLEMTKIVVMSWMLLEGVKPEDKIHEDWRKKYKLMKKESE